MSMPKRYRHWTTVLYPESCVPNWRSILDEEHIQYAVSPLHEFDSNPDGEVKKAHWHIAFVFDGVKSYDQIKVLCDMIGAVSPQRCLSLRGLIRYFCHLDNPEKHQYDISDIECHNGLDIDDCLKQTCTERHAILIEILHFIDEHDINEYWDLLILAENEHPDWLDIMFEGYTMVLTQALNSRRNSIRNRRKHKIETD